jgi:HSP20 family protein
VVYVVREVWHPPTDVYETGEVIRVLVEVAGMRREDLEVSLAGMQLTVRGNRRRIVSGHGTVHRLELYYGDFETTVTLPAPVVESGVEAAYEDGVLLITLPIQRPHRVLVDSIL